MEILGNDPIDREDARRRARERYGSAVALAASRARREASSVPAPPAPAGPEVPDGGPLSEAQRQAREVLLRRHPELRTEQA